MSDRPVIDFDFACRDDCLDRMVPSDLRIIIAERDQLKARVDVLERLIQRAITLEHNSSVVLLKHMKEALEIKT